MCTRKCDSAARLVPPFRFTATLDCQSGTNCSRSVPNFGGSIPPKTGRSFIVWICLQSVRLDEVPVLLLVLWKILMPLASWFSRAYVPMWLHSRVTRIARVRRSRLIRLARLATVGIFRIVSLRPNGHREILQFFPNQTQFVDDLFSYLVFHMDPCTFYIVRGDNSFSRHGF